MNNSVKSLISVNNKFSFKENKMREVPVGNKWPKGISCQICSKKAKIGDVVLAKEHVIHGTILLHKECVIRIFEKSQYPTNYETMKKEIKESNLYE